MADQTPYPYDQLLENCRAAVRVIRQIAGELGCMTPAHGTEKDHAQALLMAAEVLQQYFGDSPNDA